MKNIITIVIIIALAGGLTFTTMKNNTLSNEITELTKLENNETPSELPAYLVASSFMPEGHGSLIPYGEAAHPMMEKWGWELIIAWESTQFLDQYEWEWKTDEFAKFTLFKFPSMKHLQWFWNSKEYQSVKHLRHNVMKPNFTFGVEWFDETQWELNNL